MGSLHLLVVLVVKMESAPAIPVETADLTSAAQSEKILGAIGGWRGGTVALYLGHPDAPVGARGRRGRDRGRPRRDCEHGVRITGRKINVLAGQLSTEGWPPAYEYTKG